MADVRALLKNNSNSDAEPEDNVLRVLIVDDEPTVHEITSLVLKGYKYGDFRLELVSAYSATEAREVLVEKGPFALILLDVIMETDDAGLTLAQYIREELKDPMVRIILRTGEPGMVPQKQVMRDYEIDDYKEKAELTSERFDATVTASIRTFLGFSKLEENRQGLMRILDAIREVEGTDSTDNLAERILEQIEEVMNRTGRPGIGSVLISRNEDEKEIVTSRGKLENLSQTELTKLGNGHTVKLMEEALETGSTVHDGNHIMTTLLSSNGGRYLAYFEDIREFGDTERYLVELYASHVNVSLDNKLLNRELVETQKEIISTLGEIIETKSGETGAHVRRVGELARLLAEKLGFDQSERELMMFAAPLHDVGKVGISELILGKPGKLTDDEYEIVKTHARIGYEILKSSKRPVLQMGARICLQHHEWWNGKGYPEGVSGLDISIEARICSVVDVLDALRSERSYKPAFSLEESMDIINQGRGTQFDPELVDLLNENLDRVKAIYDSLPD